MRLLRHKSNSDLEVVTFDINDIPPYAILSHTWVTGQEVTYEELVAGTGKEKSGYDKIHSCGARAAQDGLEFFWVDTCCVDKRSSSELQEAINSMFSWYQDAAMCYAYLSDVADAASVNGPESQFYKSRWHSRGWTLQELLAPRVVKFYGQGWTPVGTKETLSSQLSEITRIPVDILGDSTLIGSASVAQRMSWAAQRQTSRPEDIAYCLMGIFSVKMAMLYGEGKAAFLRLQEAICQHSNDNSIFAWRISDGVEDQRVAHGLLADHPRHFDESWAVSSDDTRIDIPSGFRIHHAPLKVANYGIQMESYMLTLRSSRPQIGILVLRCRIISGTHCDKGYLGILVQGRWLPGHGFMYVRIKSDTFILSRHRPSSTQELAFAKAGPIPLQHYAELEDLDTSRYELAAVEDQVSGQLRLSVAPLYISRGPLFAWDVIAWTAFHRCHAPFGPEKTKALGQITFQRDDAKTLSIYLGVSREVRPDRFFPIEYTSYVGMVAWAGEAQSTIRWLPDDRRVDCGDEHRVYVYADRHEKAGAVYLDFTYLIRIRPNDGGLRIVLLPLDYRPQPKPLPWTD